MVNITGIRILSSINTLPSLALQFLILNASRAGEVIQAEKSQINGDIWVIPAERMKARVEHQIPLAAESLTLINKAAVLTSDGPFLFCLEGKRFHSLYMINLVQRFQPTVTTHGFRSKASLNHIVKEKLCADTSNIFWTCPKGHRTEVERLVPKLRGKVTLKKPLEIADVNEDFIEDDDIAESDEEKGKTHSSWLPCNIKARNDFGHITNCLYAFSLNPPPLVLNLLVKTSGISAKKINATFKLNNLLQFIYRGSIREKQPMNLCIIPADTRALLDDFLKHY